MPYSSPIFDSELELYFREVRHSSVLDIGAGEGKYGEMLRSRIIVVKFPVQMVQDPYQGHKSEAHISVWSEHDFRGMDYLFAERDSICLALIRGYLNQTLEWLPDSVMRRFGYASTADFYARDAARLSVADVESRRQAAARSEIRAIIPSGSTYILVDELQTRLAADAEHRALPFLERDGEYWGLPADSQEAIREIERMRGSGCTHVVFAWPALWWLDHYREMTEYLRARSRCVLESDRFRIFDLRA